MTYQQAIDYLFSQLPMFQRIGPAAFKKDLTNTIRLCELLGNPHQQFKSIHIAGTNGKGSVTHMLGAVLQEHGLKVGLYTSPHLKDFRERIKINGQMMEEAYVIDFVEKYHPYFDEIQPSFFEITVAMAFDYFAKQQVDVAVIEVGLGGRLDSTNVITPLLSVITNISYDHQQFLGNTLPEIASEKAGIIKAGIPVVIGETQPETKDIFIATAKACNAPLFFADEKYQIGQQPVATMQQLSVNILEKNQPRYKNLQLDLAGKYQLKNILTALQSIDILRGLGYPIKDEEIYNAIRQVTKLTHFIGRWHILFHSPLIITDCAHNAAGLAYAMEQLLGMQYRQLHIVFGMVKDKDAEPLLSLLPKHATYYFCKPDIPRGLDENSLKETASHIGLNGDSFPSVQSALKAAKLSAGKDDLIYVGGSMFVLAEVI